MRLVDAALAVSLGLKGPGDDFMLLTLCREVPSDVLRLGRLPGVARGLRAGATRACTICNTRTGYDYKVVRR